MNKRLRGFFCINSNDNFSNQILIFHLAARIFLFFVFLQFYTRPVPQSEILMNISIRTKERHWEHCNSCISIGITFKQLTYLMVQVCRVDTMACSCFPEDNGLGKRGSAERIPSTTTAPSRMDGVYAWAINLLWIIQLSSDRAVPIQLPSWVVVTEYCYNKHVVSFLKFWLLIASFFFLT